MNEPAPGALQTRPLVQPGDLLALLGILILGIGLRLVWFSGLGLGDDILLRYDIAAIVNTGRPNTSPTVYRFAWWIPTVITARWFGLKEAGLITPIVVFDALGIVAVYLIGKALWGRPGAVVAALLVVATPLDFAWSTMFTTDMMLSVFAALTMLFALRALQQDREAWRRRDWIMTAASLWLAYHSKLSASFLVPAIVCLCWAYRDRLDATVGAFIATAAILFAGTLLVTYVLSGDLLAPYHIELRLQGLTGAEAKGHVATWSQVWLFVNWLFFPIWFGVFLFSFYTWAFVVLALVGLFLRVRPSAALIWWFLFMLFGMTFNVQRVDGVWVNGFRNFRHAHALVYPLDLLLAGYLVAWWTRHRASARVAIAALLAVGLWQSITTARITHIAFGDMRTACHYLATLPPRPVYTDFQLGARLQYEGMDERGFRPTLVPTLEPDKMRELLTSPKPAYLVTGGGREPYYGCTHCIPRAANVPAGHWRLLVEFPDPIPATSWRPETQRIWETTAAP